MENFKAFLKKKDIGAYTIDKTIAILYNIYRYNTLGGKYV